MVSYHSLNVILYILFATKPKLLRLLGAQPTPEWLLNIVHNQVQSQHSVFHPNLYLDKNRWKYFPNATHFAFIPLHKVTPGSCSMQLQCSSVGAAGLSAFVKDTTREVCWRKGRVLFKQSQACAFTLRSLKVRG